MFEIHESRPHPSVVGRSIRRLPTIGVASLFIVVGYTKFDNDPNGEWFRLFELIGIGQWFRYATGLIQIAGGVLMLSRRSQTAGAAMLACTMIGAALVDVFVLGSPCSIRSSSTCQTLNLAQSLGPRLRTTPTGASRAR